jgi:hypothetical protein
VGLSPNEIRKRAIEFAHEWRDEKREHAEAKTFWDSFFNVFGLSRRRIASFEEPVKNLPGDKKGYIDLFWRGQLLVEHKSRGKNLDKAYTQAFDYFLGIKDEEDLPKFILLSDFERFKLLNVEEGTEQEFKLSDFHKNIHLFDFILGIKRQKIVDEDPVNIKAAQLMGEIHDTLKDSGYTGHQLEVFLARMVFCLFADDTGIFTRDNFAYYVESRTNQDGSDLGARLTELFQTLDTKENERQKNLDEDLQSFPYINGKLFSDNIKVPAFDSNMRHLLIKCSHFDWSKVSPAVFGSLFQLAMDKKKRKELGAHYTSEKNILKAVKSLFLDDLRLEYESCKNNKKKLNELQEKISKIKILDPACGCGTFLVISYRELRLLETEIILRKRKLEGGENQTILDIDLSKGIDVDAMYGIELEELPARIAEVALWLVDHQMNIGLSEKLGFYYVRLPLSKAPNIHIGNALRMDWNNVVPRVQLNYIIGNPPFVAKKNRNDEQNEDMKIVFNEEFDKFGVLDYVASWYVKASQYISGTAIKVAFVSTKSITEGEQVSILWAYLMSKGMKIHFAHRSFSWTNEARGKAAVFVIIVGFAAFDIKNKMIFDYETPKSDPVAIPASNISPYLIDQVDFVIPSRRDPICRIPPMVFGSMPNDGGHLLFTEAEKKEFLEKEPEAGGFLRPFISGEDFLYNVKRWCLWLDGVPASEIRINASMMARIELVKEYRLKSQRETTRKLADMPYLFGEIRQPDSDYFIVPLNSSETRKYIPMGFEKKEVVASNTCGIISNASLYHFGILISSMHMSWIKQVCGKLEGRYRYSNSIVYNNFPWPENPSTANIKEIERIASELLRIRDELKGSCLADLYNPNLMPKKLLDVHNKLDKAVDRCYRKQPFVSDLNRLKFLFGLYRKYVPDSQNTNLDQYSDLESD